MKIESGETPGNFKVSYQRKKLILCFDGTGNKFKGNQSDTNILKIFRMLDRSGDDHGEHTRALCLFLLLSLEQETPNIVCVRS